MLPLTSFSSINAIFNRFGFEVEITHDQSLTLRLQQAAHPESTRPESMHHSGGAAAETRYIYVDVICKALEWTLNQKNQADFKVAVVGLGLGYIEIGWAQSLLQTKHSSLEISRQITLDTFEVVPQLQSFFSNWFLQKKTDPESLLLHQMYEFISLKLNDQVNPSSVAQVLKDAQDKSFLRFQNDLLQFVQAPPQSWNLICYDAFSSKTSSLLWSASFLNDLLEQHASENCIFTTYACTGNLKTALKNKGFRLIKRPGFLGKRDSTLAVRGCYEELEF